MRFQTLKALEMAAQFSATRTAEVAITTKPNIQGIQVAYLGSAEFAYFLNGATKVRETSRDFAHDVLSQDVAHTMRHAIAA